MTDRFSLLVCLHCTEDAGGDRPLVMPFGSVTEMREWWAAHKAGTGHTWGWRNRDGEQPGPDEAAAEALEWMRESAKHAPPRYPPNPLPEAARHDPHP